MAELSSLGMLLGGQTLLYLAPVALGFFVALRCSEIEPDVGADEVFGGTSTPGVVDG